MVSTDPMNMHLLLVIFAWVSQNYRFPCRAISQKVCGSYKQDRCYMTFWVLLCSPAEVATPWVKEDVKLIFACVLRTGSLLHDTGCCYVHPPRWQLLGSKKVLNSLLLFIVRTGSLLHDFLGAAMFTRQVGNPLCKRRCLTNFCLRLTDRIAAT